MRALVLDKPGKPLRRAELPVPRPARGGAAAARARVRRLPHGPAPARRRGARGRASRSCSATRSWAWSRAPVERARVPVARGHSTARAAYCMHGHENLCDAAASPAPTSTAAIAEYAVADARFCIPIPPGYPDSAGGAAPVRRLDRLPRLRMAGDARAARDSTVSARRRTSSCQVARCRKAGACSPSRAPAIDAGQAFARRLGAGGPAAGRPSAGRAGRRDHLRAGRRSSYRARSRRAPRAAPSSAPAST